MQNNVIYHDLNCTLHMWHFVDAAEKQNASHTQKQINFFIVTK